MDGRVYTLEDEIITLADDLARARRHLLDQEHAGSRVANEALARHTLRKARERVAALEAELREACAQQIAAAEGFRTP